MTVVITVDTEEDDWYSYATDGASVRNIAFLPELQEHFDRWGSRPTYLVNRPPLLHRQSVQVLGMIAESDAVEIGAHLHPWNTPPFGDEGAHRSMMCVFSEEENRAKIREIRRRLEAELGVTPNAFRAGRWGFGPTVASALVAEGFAIDCSVTPLVDWSNEIGGVDHSAAPMQPYRFHPKEPHRPAHDGSLLQFPPTIGFFSGDHRRRDEVRKRLGRSPLRHVKIIGVLDRLGLLSKRWLSPESSSGPAMVRLAEACIASGHTFLHLTFHSVVLLTGATPFVRDERDRTLFLKAIDQFLSYCERSGFVFRTLTEASLDFAEAERPAALMSPARPADTT